MVKLNLQKSVVLVLAMTISLAIFSQKQSNIVKVKHNTDTHIVALERPDNNTEGESVNNQKSHVAQNQYIDKKVEDTYRGREVLVNEDFSLFVLGTEDEPDTTTPLAGSDYYIDPDYTQQPGWSGAGVFQAGQTCAITDDMNGLLNTPEMEMSGTITVSFRIKLLPWETVDQTTIYCNLLTGGIYNPFPIAYDGAIFTHDWTELSFTFENDESNDCYLQFKAFRTHIIDDIVVTRAMDFIPAPNAEDATEYTMDGFTTGWNEVYSAEDYLLTVFRKIPAGNDSVYVLEGFDEINNDGTFIDEENPNYPEGWHINLDAGNIRQVITGDGNYISAPQALCMDSIGDTIILPNNGGRFASAYVNVKLVEYNGESGSIEFKVKRSGQWSDYLYMPLGGIYDSVGLGWVRTEMLWNPDKYEEMAIIYNSEGSAVIAIDDVEFTTSPPTTTDFIYHDFPVQDTTYTITDLDPAYDYYYYVKAHNSEFTSVTSNWVNVFGLAPPDMYEATDITEVSYQANWDAHPKADRYEIHNYDVFTTPVSVDDYVVLSEDFSLVQNGGTPENPVVDYNIYRHRLDMYTERPDWYGTSTIYADGMIGAGYNDYFMGGITTPEMSLENNSTFTVKAKIYCTQGETIVIFSSEETHEVTFSETGIMNIEMEFVTGENSDRERLRIYSAHAYNFLIDQFTVTQSLSADDKLYQMISWNEITSGDVDHYVFDGLWYNENHSYAYDINAIHTAFGDDYWSDISDRIDVSILIDIDESSVETYSLFPNPANDMLFVSCDNVQSIEIFNMQGQVILRTSDKVIDVSTFKEGIYVVAVTTDNYKTETSKILITHR